MMSILLTHHIILSPPHTAYLCSRYLIPYMAMANDSLYAETNFQFSGFPGYPHPVTAHSSPQGLPPTPPNGMVGYPPQAQLPAQPQQHTFPAQPSPQTGDKRKAPSAADLEEASRAAAEEDKRRRNTAASARFRVKKKQREQALEKTAKEMSEKVQVLEARVGQLEMENKWLKGLITEKNIKGLDVDSKKEGEQGDESERSSEERKKGVGTGKEAAKIE